MTTARAAAYVGVGTILIAWFASASSVVRPPRQPARSTAQTDEVVLTEIAAGVQTQAARLRRRLASAPTPRASVRNPFRFDPRAAPASAVPRDMVRATSGHVEHVEAVPDPAPVEPTLTLLGIAGQKTATGTVRTAMLSMSPAGDDLILAVEGQDVAGRYRVTTVGEDAVELKDLATGATRRLVLR